MKLGYIGLGKMGYNMAERLLKKGHNIAAYNRSPGPTTKLKRKGVIPSYSINELVSNLTPPRTIWLMVPHSALDQVLSEVMKHLSKGDVIIDGGNSYYKNTIRRGKKAESKGFYFLDVGVSGGPGGAKNGACLMVGGKRNLYKKYEKLFRDIAAPEAFGYMGKTGAGHFVKMIHNGIEYGMMQAIAEGFTIMKKSKFNLNLTDISDVYNHRSVVESRLVGWLKDGFEMYGEDLKKVSGSVGHTGEGEWTVHTAKEFNVAAPIIKGALQFRKHSKSKFSYTGQLLSVMRNMFGGHNIKK